MQLAAQEIEQENGNFIIKPTLEELVSYINILGSTITEELVEKIHDRLNYCSLIRPPKVMILSQRKMFYQQLKQNSLMN